MVEGVAAPAISQVAEEAERADGSPVAAEPQFAQGTIESRVESKVMETRSEVAPAYEGAGEVLLDLGDFQTGRSLDEEFVLDIDLDEAPEPSPVEPAFASASFYSRPRFGAGAPSATITPDLAAARPDQLATTQEFQRERSESADAARDSSSATFSDVRVMDAPADESGEASGEVSGEASGEVSGRGAVVAMSASAAAATEISTQQLSPEMIDAIAKRVVEHMSASVVQEIAWEVVPQLAELFIKRQLEEKNS